MPNAVDNLTDNFAAWGIEKPHVVGNSLGGALALELGARGAVSSVTALSPAGFFGMVNRVQTFVLLILLRISSKLPDRVLKFVSQKAWGRKLAGSTLYTHPERFTADEVYGDALSLKRATGFERTILVWCSLLVQAPGSRADNHRLGHPRPHPPVRLIGDRTGAHARCAPRRAPALRPRADDRRSGTDRPRHQEHR